jgi:hypothetical protein
MLFGWSCLLLSCVLVACRPWSLEISFSSIHVPSQRLLVSGNRSIRGWRI